MLLIYFVPFIYLFVCYLVVRVRETVPEPRSLGRGKAAGVAIGTSGLLLTLFAMVIATIPPPDTADPWLFRIKVIGGAGLFVLMGGFVYWRGRRTNRS
jgi:hypothetical protein